MLLFIRETVKCCVSLGKRQRRRAKLSCFQIIVWVLKLENFNVNITTSKDVIFLPDFLEIQETKHELIEETMFEFSCFNCEV